MKELPCLEEIYDFETEQLESVLNEIDQMIGPGQPRPTQLPRGFDNYEKFERKANKLREHIELELDERRQVDDVISFFVSKSKKGGVDILNDDQFYQPAAASSKPKPDQPIKHQVQQAPQQQSPQQLYLNPQNLAKLIPDQQPNISFNPQTTTPSDIDGGISGQKSSIVNRSTAFDQDLSDVHSSVSKQLYGNRGTFGAGKKKMDLQAFMREKLAKTKISSEATTNIQNPTQVQKNFTGGSSSVKKQSDDTRSTTTAGTAHRSTTTEKPNIYKPQLKSTKEQSYYVSGPVNPIKPQAKKGGARKRSASKEAPSTLIDMSKVQNSYVVVGPGEVKKKQAKPAAKPKEENSKQEDSGTKEDSANPEKKDPLRQSQQSNIYKPPIMKKPGTSTNRGQPNNARVNKGSSEQSKKNVQDEKKKGTEVAVAKIQKEGDEVGKWDQDESSKTTDQAESDDEIMASNNHQSSTSNSVSHNLSSVQASATPSEDKPDETINNQGNNEEIESHYSDDVIPGQDNHSQNFELMRQGTVHSSYDDDEAITKPNAEQQSTNNSTNPGGISTALQEESDDDDQDEHDDDEEIKVAPGSKLAKTQDDQEDEGLIDDEDFYSKLGNTAVISRQDLDHSALEKNDQQIHRENIPSGSGSTLENKKAIRGKVQLIVDEASLQNSALTTPRDTPQKQELQENTSNTTTPIEEVKQPAKPISKGLEMIRKTMNQAQDEAALKVKQQLQEERLKQIRMMMDQEKKQRENNTFSGASINPNETTASQSTDNTKKNTAAVDDPSVKGPAPKDNSEVKTEGESAPNKDTAKPKPKKAAAKKDKQAANNVVKEIEVLPGGLQVVDYSHLYKSFYDIFVGQVLEPKTFDLQFVVRDTRNTYAQFVSLMTMDMKRNKYQFEQAPLEKSSNDYMQMMPNFFNLTSDNKQNNPDLMMQALAQAELKDRYQNLIKHRDITDILRDASEKAAAALPPTAETTVARESSLFYRVVKNRSEVYDIISRGFARKKGWNELPHGLDLRNSWNLLWTWSKIKIDLTKLLVWQKCNHFSGAKNVSRKDFLKRNIEMAQRMSPKANQVFNISPLTFILPKEYVNFLETFSELEDKEGKFNYWIMKPAAKSRGRGISLVNDLSQISYGEPIVVQRYIKNPLLINGYKFDMRIYVVVTSVNPLEAFLYRDGFGRFSTIPFSLDPTDKNNKYIHLTNVSIQKYNQSQNNEYEKSEEGAADAMYGGTKISIPTLKKRVQAAINVNWDEQIWPQIKEVIVKSLVACQNDIQYNPCAFELFGYDILLDDDLKCWLIEVNSSPSLARDTILDDMVKSKLIDDIIDLMDPIDFDRKRLFEVLERRIAEDFKGGGISTGQASKKLMNRDLTYILNGRVPRRYGEMPRRMGNFERIAPSPMCEQYLKLIGGQKMFGSLMKIGAESEQQISGQKPKGGKGQAQQVIQQQQVIVLDSQ